MNVVGTAPRARPAAVGAQGKRGKETVVTAKFVIKGQFKHTYIFVACTQWNKSNNKAIK